MGNAAVINTSPLVFFAGSRRMDLLREFADPILVPRPVADEIRAKRPKTAAAMALEHMAWIQIVQPVPVPNTVIAWRLGAGESSVLAYACAHRGMEAIIDDLAGRKCAAAMGIPVRGTLGIVLVAKQRGLIASARSVMEEMIQAGLYLSKSVLDTALRRVGE